MLDVVRYRETCDLRKPCVICKTPYGRALRASGAQEGYFESVSSWLRTKVCSPECRTILRAWAVYMRPVKRPFMNDVAIAAFQQFLYTGEANNVPR